MFSEANSAFSSVYELDLHRREITHKKTKFGSPITDEFLIKKKKIQYNTHTHTKKTFLQSNDVAFCTMRVKTNRQEKLKYTPPIAKIKDLALKP